MVYSKEGLKHQDMWHVWHRKKEEWSWVSDISDRLPCRVLSEEFYNETSYSNYIFCLEAHRPNLIQSVNCLHLAVVLSVIVQYCAYIDHFLVIVHFQIIF